MEHYDLLAKCVLISSLIGLGLMLVGLFVVPTLDFIHRKQATKQRELDHWQDIWDRED